MGSWHPLKKIQLFFIIAALAAGIISLLLIYPSIHPLKMTPTTVKRLGPSTQTIAADFDHDGYSELIHIYEQANKQITSLLVTNSESNPLEQFNLKGSTKFYYPYESWVFFSDINNDVYDEIFAFHQEEDTTYLSIIDVPRKTFIVDNQKLLIRKQHYGKFKNWDIYYNDKLVDDIDGDGTKELIFTVVSGYSLKPRGIFRYDLKQFRITHRYYTNASFIGISAGDLNSDGKKELAVSTYAGGNYPPDSAFSDAFSWLFVFDSELRPLFPPKKFSGFTSGINVRIIQYKNNPMLWVFHNIGGVPEIPGEVLLITATGEITYRQKLPFRTFTPIINDHEFGRTIAYIRIQEDGILKCMPPFTILQKTSEFNDSYNNIMYEDINWDSKPEIAIAGRKNIYIYDYNLNLLGQYPIPRDLQSLRLPLTIRWIGPHKLPQLLISGKGHHLLLQVNTNPWYGVRFFIPLLFMGLTYGGLVFFHKILGLLFIYVGFLLSYLKSTVNGVLILDSKNKILSHNPRINALLNLPIPIKKGMAFDKVFENYPEIVKIVQKAQEDQKELQTVLSLQQNKNFREIKLFVKPLLAYFNIPYGYLIEIQDLSEIEAGHRVKLWSKTVQKLAHDIKAPLTSIRVGLKTLEIYIQQSSLPNKSDILMDVHSLRSEIERVHNITKNFLKFVNMEQPNFAIADIHHIIQRSVERFTGFFEDPNAVQLATEFDPAIGPFYIDSQQMEMVFNILIENAIDAMGGKGTLTIATNKIDDILKESFPLCEIEITDSGKGLSKEELDQIFNPFFTTKEHGTGLGLTIAKKIIEDHGGTITAYSKKNIGTTFRIVLPMRS